MFLIKRRKKIASQRIDDSKFTLMPIKYHKGLVFYGDPICTIDLSGFHEGQSVVITPCNHIFHTNCLKEWFNSEKVTKTCPNDNQKLENCLIGD